MHFLSRKIGKDTKVNWALLMTKSSFEKGLKYVRLNITTSFINLQIIIRTEFAI